MLGPCRFTGCPRGVYTETVPDWCLEHFTRHQLWDRYPHLRDALTHEPDSVVMHWGMGRRLGVVPGPDRL